MKYSCGFIWHSCGVQAVRHGVRNLSQAAETAATLGLGPRHKQCQIHLQVWVFL